MATEKRETERENNGCLSNTALAMAGASIGTKIRLFIKDRNNILLPNRKAVHFPLGDGVQKPQGGGIRALAENAYFRIVGFGIKQKCPIYV